MSRLYYEYEWHGHIVVENVLYIQQKTYKYYHYNLIFVINDIHWHIRGHTLMIRRLLSLWP